MKDKPQWRAWAKKRRAQLSPDALVKASAAICGHIAALPRWQNAQRIMLYYPMAGEVNVLLPLQQLWREGRQVLLPRIRQGQLMACRYQPGDVLSRSRLGVLEPDAEDAFMPQEVQLCLVPGLVFCAQGYRIGFGKGYYDRFLSGCPAYSIGVCLDAFVQLQPLWPVDANDIPVQTLITEHGVLHVDAK